MSVDVAIAAVLSELDGKFTLKEEHKNDTGGFSLGDDVVSFYS